MNSTDHLSELESLRSQVADLTRALAERDVSMRDLREQSNLLRTIIEGTAAETGDEFFASLVTHLTSTLHVQYAVIGEVCEGRLKKIRTLAVATGGTLVDNFEYELAHTPCATTLTQGFACFDRDLQATFPQFQRLADFGAESYCAVSLRANNAAVIGVLVVMDTKPLQHGDDLQSLLGVFAPRIAAEFERKRAQQERAQALADLHNVIETIPDIVFALDTQGNLVKWNRRLGDVTGYSPEELLNKPALAFVPLEEQTRTAAAIQRVFTEGYAELDGQMLTKDLRTIPYHWTGALLKNAQGEPIGITGVGRDVSEKKKSEEELTQQRRHLVDAQALAHLGSWGWDIETGEVQWSDELFRIFGQEPGSIHVMHDTFLAALLPDDHDRVLAAINAALAGKMSYDIEYRIVRPNSEVRSIHARGDVYRDATGHPLSMAGTALDITERKRIEDALRTSEERYRSLYDDTPTMYFTLATNGTVLSVNRFGADQLGYRVEELVGKSVLGIFHKDDQEVAVACLSGCLVTPEKTRNWEFRKVRKDGRIIWVRETAHVSQSSGGATVVLVTCEDITARKWMEDALRQREGDLRAAIEERERISQDLHDGILQSLFAVGLTLEASKSMMSPGNRKTAGPPLDQAISQLNCVMREIRNFIAGLGSDLLKGKDLQSALQHMLDSLTQNQATHVRLAVEDRAAQAVSVEQSLHLLLVIQEAVSNCIRHGCAQEATVSLKMLKQGIRLSVRDNGRGFNPKAATGTGHGLANMAVRARKIGGRFTVLSKVNEGTRIVLDLPKEASDVLR
ncbi:MAG TPA: PAS domain S-box protein [Nitrospiraceae bacterium]|nr:PAS domain S-box protein [Nitrospiraceae bacterium]